MKRRWMAIALLMLLGGCGEWSMPSRYAAAANAAAFIRAARWRNQAAFDAYIDWPAVRSDIRAQLTHARGAGRASPTDGTWKSAAVDQMIRPSHVHFRAPPGSFGGMLGAAHLALMVRPAGGGRLCLPEGSGKKSCVLTFAREAAGWKVTGMSLDLFRVDDAPAGRSEAG